jgi:thiol-disulfide isomerase/thioredoxin
VRWTAISLVLLLCGTLAGCASLNPKNWSIFAGGPKRSKPADPERIPPPDPPEAMPTSNRTKPGQNSGVLAGRVIDAFNQKQPGAAIQVVATDASPNETPLEVQTNEQGYFMVQGLQPGARYKLLARTKRGEQMLAGQVLASPPNVVLVIKVSEDFAGPDTPPPPPPGKETPGARPGEKKPADKKSAGRGTGSRGSTATASSDPAPDPGGGPPKYLFEPDRARSDRLTPTPARPAPPARAVDGGARLGTPVPDRAKDPPRPPPVRPEYQTLEPRIVATDPPRAAIPGPTPFPEPPAAPRLSTLVGQAPSCRVVGNRVEDFALKDTAGQTFHLNQLRGRLVLLDFWGTWCEPCLRALPHLTELHRRYGPQGLEVVGISYDDGPVERQVQTLAYVRQRHGIGYRLILGGGDDCPVLRDLGVKSFPTLILLDRDGTILWRGEGLTSQNEQRLEAEIRKRLK